MVSCANREQKDKTQDEKIGRFLSGVSHTLMFMSGKGGVGKSTTAVNAALFLSDLGYRVGLLDIDIHGPSVAGLLGLKGMPLNIVGDKIQPFQMNENLRVVTFQGFLDNPDQPIIWRGPVKMGVILQLLADVDWGELDFLIIDSPPGTGDEPLTIAQRIPDCRAVIITTPQEIALADVRKSLNFCKQTNIRIMGIIENMSGFVCPTCGERHDIFKSGGGEKTAAQWGVPFLGRIPIDPGVVEAGDQGSGIVKADSPAKSCLEDIVRRITENLKQEKGDGQMAMKIGIPLAGGKLCNHFGHCEEFALVSVTNGEITDVTKRVPPPHEPGIIPEWLAEQGVDTVLAGGMGERAQDIFRQKGIKVVCGAQGGSPQDIAASFLQGTLMTGGNPCSHDEPGHQCHGG
ncbi:MAG: iron-sulfur cluster carrier protein MrpORP [Sporomusaceae bacterium]|nr:iron-sulfur cluster carrier protein MrpORP [Sporomusaceae bacterium]